MVGPVSGETWTRDDSWTRRKQVREKWPRYAAEIPPELAALIDEAQRVSLGVNYSPANATRANVVRAGLRLYLEAKLPEPPAAVEGTAEEIVDRRELAERADPG